SLSAASLKRLTPDFIHHLTTSRPGYFCKYPGRLLILPTLLRFPVVYIPARVDCLTSAVTAFIHLPGLEWPFAGGFYPDFQGLLA
ncbi:hypothetical protein, partial [Citrobacter koseri]|uniref:hypothetical protein n=1 Tax=Citrobacter koseri TaxID=545 RepID=UPI00200B87DF